MRNSNKNLKYEMQKPIKVGLLLRKYLKGMKYLKYPVKIKDPVYIVPYETKSERDRILKCSNFITNLYGNRYSKEYIDTLCTMLYCNFEDYTRIRSKINFDNIRNFIKYKNLYDKKAQENIKNERKNEEDEFKEEIKKLFSCEHKKYKRNFSEKFKCTKKNKNDNCVKSIENKISCINIFNSQKKIMNDDTNSFKTQCVTYNNNFLVSKQINKKAMNTISANNTIKGEKIYKLKDSNNNTHKKKIKSFINNEKPTYINPKANTFYKQQRTISFYKPVKTTDFMPSCNSTENYETLVNHDQKSMDKKEKNILKRNATLEQNFQTIETVKSTKKRNIRSAFIKTFPKFEKFSKYKVQFENSLNRNIMKIPDKIRVKNLLLNGEYFVKMHRESLVQQEIKRFNGLALKERKKLFDNDDILL